MRWASVLLVWIVAGAAIAQSDYPARAVRIVVPSLPGGGTDIVARVLGQQFSTVFGQPFVVDNKPGAGNMIGIEAVARAAPDGYTLLMVPSTLALNSVLYKKVPYHPVRDFTPITLAATAPLVLIVHPALPAQSLAEFLDLARKQPGRMSYGTAGIGTAPHLCMELLKSMAGIDLVHIPYKGTAPAAGDVAGGQLAAMFATALTARPMIDSRRVRALAVSGPQRVGALPGVPPVAEAGVPGYSAMQWYGLLAPAGTPPAIVARLNAEALRSLRTGEMKERLAADGAEPQGSTPEEFGALIRSELDKWTRVARAAGIEPQ